MAEGYGDSFEFNFQDSSQFQQGSHIASPQMQQQNQQTGPTAGGSVLSQEEFDSLIKSIQLLRISQLRYIVQKYSIPASGNKTKLLSLVIQIFHNLRYDSVLVEIYHDIGNLLAQQDAPFQTPTFTSSQLELSPPNPEYEPAFNPSIIINPDGSVFGPILAKPGRTSGRFSFPSPPQIGPTVVSFLFYKGNTQPFSILFELNGIPFEISKDDSQPAPIDVANVLSAPGVENYFDIKSMNTAVPVMIQLFQYEYVGIKQCLKHLCGTDIDLSSEKPLVKTNTCLHEKPFSLVLYLSDALATGKWVCPICGADAQLQNLIPAMDINDQTSLTPQPTLPPPSPVPPPQQESIFGAGTAELFHVNGQIDHFDWDPF